MILGLQYLGHNNFCNYYALVAKRDHFAIKSEDTVQSLLNLLALMNTPFANSEIVIDILLSLDIATLTLR